MAEDLRKKIAFSMIRNINAALALRLLSRVGSLDALFSLPMSSLAAAGHLPSNLTDQSARDELLERAKKEEEFILANEIEALYFTDDAYPTRLSNCDDGPVMLYQLGNDCLNARHVVSIVGTRRATPQGVEVTRRIVKELSERLDDLVIVSGLAYGIDVAAHKAALEFDVPTVAVLANPLNTIYPADHRGIAANILRKGGALVSEYSTSHEVHKSNFLARNRIIAGISDATIVVESDSQGGSLVTAGLAIEYNREVYAVPGRLTDKYSQGTLGLIAAQKANIFTGVEDFLCGMGWNYESDGPQQQVLEFEFSSDEQAVYDFLVQNPASRVNEIVLSTKLPQGQVSDILFRLEMRDAVMSMAGGKYSAL